MPNFLESITAEDLMVYLNEQHFVAVQSMRERFRQEITWRGAFGVRGPRLRSIRPADENTVSFSFVLLNDGVAYGLNSYKTWRDLQDFTIKTKKGKVDPNNERGKKGETLEVYGDCNWTDIDIDSSLTEVMVNVDVSVPGFQSFADNDPNT